MILIRDKRKCCGCTACVAVCPKNCITMREDNEGFLYPFVDTACCIDCGLCEKICPAINPYKIQIAKPESYACINKNESIRLASSSGGLFTALAEQVINNRGVVFGAKFNERWEVVHDWTDTIEGLADFRGSKYVQSQLGDCYLKVKSFLKDGRQVLFSGVPCQIAGLNHFLPKSENLFTVDLICYSVPSPKVFRMYLEKVVTCQIQTEKNTGLHHFVKETKSCNIDKITFRDKSFGWKKYCFALRVRGLPLKSGRNTALLCEPHYENVYMKGFFSGLFTRPSCHSCPARNYSSGSDITIADCWGIDKYHPEMDDSKGTSLALIITEKGARLFNSIKNKLKCLEIPYEEVGALGVHASISKSPKPSLYRNIFLKIMKERFIINQMKLFIRLPSRLRLISNVRTLLYKILGKDIYVIKRLSKCQKK